MEEKDKEVLKEEQPKTEPEKTETVKVNSNVQKIATEENVENKPASSQTKVRLKPKFVPSEDAKQTKNFAWLAYILFFIPLLINSKSAFVRHHANEGLEINIFDLIGTVLLLVGALVETTNNAVNALKYIKNKKSTSFVLFCFFIYFFSLNKIFKMSFQPLTLITFFSFSSWSEIILLW